MLGVVLPALKDCAYSAFVSYAHADDIAHFGWVTHFCRELQRVLPAVARIPRLPPMHQSGGNGPVAGVLSDELEANLARSFAMIIVVGDNYLDSVWCRHEIEYFAARFGEQGLRQRLFVVAMSEPAMLVLQSRPTWQTLMPEGAEQLWLGFFGAEERGQPLGVYAGEGLVSPRFVPPFRRLLDGFATRLKAEGGRTPPPPPPPPPPQLLSSQPPPDAPVLIGWAAPGSAAAVAEAVHALQALGVAARVLGPELLADDFAAFGTAAGATRLLLVFDTQPLLAAASVPGGHLQMQREAWLRRGRPAGQLHLLDLRADGGVADPGAVAWATAQGLVPQRLPALAALVSPLPPPPPPPPPSSAARIYIESNRHERTLWRPLGDWIQAKWEAVCAELAPGRTPPLALRARGLPVDELDTFPALDDADGVVLLWGRKTSEALVAQINKVELKLAPGRDAAPGIVAFLMPPQASSEPLPAWGWQVLRFEAQDETRVEVLEAERDELKRFLVEVFQRHQQRSPAGGPR